MDDKDLPVYTLEEARERFPPMWTIYWNQSDCPGKFVVRKFFGLVPEPDAAVCKTLAQAREVAYRAGAEVHCPRSDADDPVIVETWL